MAIANKPRFVPPHTIVIHHTGGGTLSGAVSALKSRGLGYHYIVDTNGHIHELVPPTRKTYHAYKRNTGTIGIAFVGGGKYGPCNRQQLEAICKLGRELKEDLPSVKYITGHKHIDPRGWKIDPRWYGEPANGVDWQIDKAHMDIVANETGLIFKSKFKK